VIKDSFQRFYKEEKGNMKQNISRRDFLLITGVAGGAGILAACAKATTEVPKATEVATTVPTPVPATPPPAEAVTVVFTGWGGTEENDGVLNAAKYFMEQNPDIKINWIQIPENYADKVMAMVAAGTPPDTAFTDYSYFQEYAKRGLLMDITPNIKADPVIGAADYFIEPQEEQRCTRNGKWYGIGSCWVAPHVYYNADIFQKEGITPPSNSPEEAWPWDKFLEIARQLTIDTNGKHPDESGFDKDNIERWAIQWPTWSIPLHSAIASNGGDWLDMQTGLITLDKPEATEALQKIADLMLVENVAPRGTVMSALGLTNTQMLENGKLAMAVDGSWALSWITKINATLGTAVCPKFKVPATDMQAHIHTPFAATKYPEQAWKWIRFLATEYYQLQFLKMGLWLPSQTALMTTEGMKKWFTERKGPGNGVHPAGYEKIVTEYVPKYGKVMYMPPGYNEAIALVQPGLDAIFNGNQTAEEAMKSLVPDANAVLEANK
jgi:multiple sugar transport system substrate-binding protein